MKLTWHRRKLHLRHPFNIASLARTKDVEREILFVQIEHDGQMGWGEASPASYYGQSIDSVKDTLQRAAGMLGHDPFAFEEILGVMWEHFPDQPATISAIDIALHDLAGRLLGIPVWKWFGLDPKHLPLTSFTIGIDDLDVIEQKVREAGDYPILKVKTGTAEDDQILSAIRAAAPDKALRVDANCGWNSGNVLERCRHIGKRYGVEFIEQPTPVGDHDALPAVRAAGLCPVIADESCCNVQDVLKCAGCFDGINIKLSKCGGIRPAMKMIHVARAAGLKVMLGCMIETSVGIAAAAQLAPLADWLDLDGHLLLGDDPFEGIGGEHGRLTLNDRPGIGVVER
ncbi:MAG TPA: dipeptide epimerase [Phycisphaerae bacterium]|nr:dipeptide epimerase [Phycisphaerae bacterium]